MNILVIQGPNLNLLGHRDPRIYGTLTLEQIHENMRMFAQQNGITLEFFHSNFEGEMIDKLQECIGGEHDGVLMNPAAFSHSSIALADTIMACGVPVVEVHISNLFAREDYRQKSFTGAVCAGVITGFGAYGYHLGLIALAQIITEIKAIKAQQNAQQSASSNTPNASNATPLADSTSSPTP